MAGADAPRDLLFGLLALQNGMVNQSQLVAAFGAWTLAKDRPLAEVLVSQGALTEPRRAQDSLAFPGRSRSVAHAHVELNVHRNPPGAVAGVALVTKPTPSRPYGVSLTDQANPGPS